MIRSKNMRRVCSRCRQVLAESRPVPRPGRAASHTLKSSMSSRLMPATAVTLVAASSQRANWRSTLSAAATLRGARNVPSWPR
jgi:hypothetical protein